MTVLASPFTPADKETYKLCPSDVSRHYGDGVRGFAGWQGRKDGMRCAEVRSENTESKRTNQKGEIVILFAIVFEDDVAFISSVIPPPPTTSKLLLSSSSDGSRPCPRSPSCVLI